MALDEVAPILAKHFVIGKIDTDRMIGGDELLLAYRKSERGGIPWFVFLDAGGETLATSDGPDGNVGCPFTVAEIAAFGDILKKAAPELSEADWKALERSLNAEREKLEKRRG